MTKPKTIKERESGELSQTAKTYLKDIFIEEVYGRHRPEIGTGATKKGTMVEPDSFDLSNQVYGETHFKNKVHFENDYIKGTPDDVCKEDLVIDFKSNWDIWTFSAIDYETARKAYYYQILGYMWLTEKNHGELRFALVNTPEEIIQKELYRLSFSILDLNGVGPEAEEAQNKLRVNYIFDDIAPEKRIKKFKFDMNLVDVEDVKSTVIRAREYLSSISL